MKKARNLWRDLPQGGSRYGSVLTRLFLLLCMLATTQAGWADDFTASEVVANGGSTKNHVTCTSSITSTTAKKIKSVSNIACIAISSNADTNPNSNYIQIQAAEGYTLNSSIVLEAASNNSSAGNIVAVFWEGDYNATTAQNVQTLSAPGNSSTTDGTITITFEANKYRTIRLYKRINYKDGTIGSGATGSANQKPSSSTAFNVAKISATAAASGPTAPTFSPESETTVSGSQTITINGPSGSTIYYAWATSAQDAAAIYNSGSGSHGNADAGTATTTVESGKTLYAIARKNDTNSTVASASYTIDDAAPTLSSANPGNGATDVATSGNIILTFSENVTIKDASKFTIDKGATLSTASATVNNNVVTIPYTGLANGTTYTITIGEGAVKDAAGNKNAEITYTFATVAAATKPATPVLSPTGGTYSDDVTVTISKGNSSDDVKLYYRVDNSEYKTYPNGTWTEIANDGTVTLDTKTKTKYLSVYAVSNADNTKISDRAEGLYTHATQTNLTGTWSANPTFENGASATIPTFSVTGGSATSPSDYTVAYSLKTNGGNVTVDPSDGITEINTSVAGTSVVTATITVVNTTNYKATTTAYDCTIKVNPAATVSTITKATTENGNFTVKVGGSEVTEATSGATVTVTTTPSDGYEVDAVTLSPSGTVTKASTNNYTFTMPASAVTVTVTFKESTSTKAAAPTITYTLSDGVTITNSGTTYTIINPNNKDQKVKVVAKNGTYVRYKSGNSIPGDPTKSSGTEVNGLDGQQTSSDIKVSKDKTVFYIKAIAFTDKNGSNPSDIVLFTFNTRKSELDDPTITQDDGNTFKEGDATKHATFTTNAAGATTYYVIGNEAKTKASDITSDANKHTADGSSELIDLSSFVTAEKDVIISAVSEKDGKYSEIVTTTYTYNGTKTYTVVTNNPKFRIGQRDEVLITNIKDKNGKKILFGQEEDATIDYSQYFTFTYALATNEEAQAFDASISDNAANKSYVVDEEINTSVIQSKNYTLIDEEQLPKSFIVKVTATPIGDATNYVKNESVVAYAKVTVKKRAYTGIGYAEFYWDIERTSDKLQAGEDYRVVTEGDLKNYGVFDGDMSVPNGRVIFLKVADDEIVDGKTWHHSRDVDHFCYYYGSSKLGDDKAVSDVQYYNGTTKVYRNNLIPLLISSNNGDATKKYVDDTTEEGKNILWVTVQGYEADGSQYGSPIKMKIYLTANNRPDGPTYDPSANNAVRNTAQTVAANGTGTSDVFAKFSSKTTYYHELELINEEGIMRGRNSVGVFSTEVAARKITGSQVTKVGDFYYLSNQSTNVYNYRFATTLKMDQDAYYVNVDDEFNAPTITGTYFDKIKKQNINIDFSKYGTLTYSYTNSNGADDTKVNETTGVVYTDASGSTENNKIGTKSGTVVVTVKFTSDKTKTITVNGRESVLDDAEIKYTINIVNPDEHTATISPLSRKFAGSQVVKIEADDEWDTYYTTNGEEPTATESETNIKIPAGTAVNITVGGDIEIGQSVVVKAKPINGSSQGKLVSETYEKVQPIAAPTFVPDGTGEPYYYTTKTPMEETKNRIEIRTTTAGASVYYMIDNPKVTTASNLYDGLSKVYINFNSASSHTIYAFAYKDGVQSEIVSSTYRYTTNIAVPVFHANGNSYSEGEANVNKDEEITITGPTGSTIYYTLDGTDPSVSNGQKYESGFNIFKTTTAKAVAIDGDATSKITTVVFNVPTPEKDENDFWEAIEETTPNGKLAVADRRISLIKNGDVYAYNSVKAVKGITATFGGKDNQGWAEANILEASLGSIIDGVGKYNIRNENEPEDELDNAFTPLTTSKTTTHERTFGLPAQGCFVRFEPTEDGQLTIWTMQQGALHYTNSNDNRTLCSRIIRFRPVYMIDEQGKSLTAVSRESTARLSEDWSKLETTNWLPNDGSEDQGEKNIYTSEQSTAIYNLINGLVGTKQAGDAIEPYEISGNNAIYNTLYGAAPSSDLTGYIMPSGGYAKFTFNLKAGKSYYFFANNSRVCVRGFRYVIDSSAATQDVTLEDAGENSNISSNCDATTDNVTINNRTFAANKWTALLLPFSMSATQVEQTFGENTRVIHFEKYENYKLYWKNHYYDMIVAGTPVLIYPTKEANISGLKVQIESTEANDPTGDGTYTFNGTYNRGTLNKWNIFVNNQGVTKQWTGNNGQAYKSLRAWLTGFSSAAQARSAIIGLDDNEEDDVTTGIYEIPFEGTDAGDAFAKGNNNVYSVSGMLIRKNATSLEGLPAGVYIINGKKVVIND